MWQVITSITMTYNLKNSINLIFGPVKIHNLNPSPGVQVLLL